ncbi:MAG: type VI secretion system baseplate subunit TssF [Paracraurococcus sp.]
MPPDLPLDEALLAAYQTELTYLRSAGAEFARQHGAVAAGLDLSEHASSDPHVERLIESFALLTARLQRLYDAQFPEIPQALLDILAPQLAAPVPAMTIVQFQPDPEQAASARGVTLPRGSTLHGTTPDGTAIRLQTCYPVTLWPVAIERIERPPLGRYPHLDSRPRVAGLLSLRLRAMSGRPLVEMAMPGLRVCLLGDRSTRMALYELLAGSLVGISALRHDGTPVLELGPDRLRAVGFAAEEAALPDPEHGHAAYRLLQEYAHLPEKFLFFDLHGLSGLETGADTALELLFLFERPLPERLAVGPDSLQLGCTPAINLFPQVSEPIRLTHRQVEYRLVADHRVPAIGIHSIRRVVRGTADGGSSATIPPLFSFDHGAQDAGGAMWLVRRAPRGHAIAFVDPTLDPAQPAADVVFAHLLCTNAGAAAELPVGAALQLERDAPLRGIRCLTRPTAEVAPPRGGEALWRLVSHLAVNRLSLEAGEDGLAALREILMLHAGPPESDMARQLRALVALSTRRVIRRVGQDAWRGLCRGLEVRLQVDPARFAGGSPRLFGSVLDRVLALQATGDSFTEFVLTAGAGEEDVIERWPPRTGDMPVL